MSCPAETPRAPKRSTRSARQAEPCRRGTPRPSAPRFGHPAATEAAAPSCAWRSVVAGLLLALLASCVSGCFRAHRCTEESCDYADNDCDGRVDEGFLDDAGRYVSDEHCGGCGVSCAAVFPTAAETACELQDDAPICVLLRCPEGTHRADAGSCVPDVPVACAPCSDDAECALRLPGATCRTLATGDARCFEPCSEDCGPGLACVDGACLPNSGTCECAGVDVDARFACLVTSPRGDVCAGEQPCEPGGLGVCVPVLSESCNAEDEDCDGLVDEDFLDELGRFALDPLHCGACNTPCAPPGPNMLALCVGLPSPGPDGLDARCDVSCEPGFVDVDGLVANGCECQRWDGEGPPPVVGGDADCDGVVDDDDAFVHVTPTGNDSDPGTLLRPMRSVGAALVRGAALGKDVLVAGGVYPGLVTLVPGVGVFGGYRVDFRDRDLGLYPVTLERPDAPGQPVIVCRDVRTATRLDGFQVRGSDASASGQGSTALYLDGCGPELTLSNVSVVAGRGQDGLEGDDSSDNLAELDAALTSLDELEGREGTEGGRGTGDDLCRAVTGGTPGVLRCGATDVSGGRGADESCVRLACTNGSPCANAGCTDFTSGGVCDIATVLALAVPNPAAQAGRGPAAGAAGATTYDAPTNRAACNFCDDNPTLPRDGDDGVDGGQGVDGRGGMGCTGAPEFDASTGRLRGHAGADGAAGTHGSGGGGGSSGAGYAIIGGTGFCAGGDRAGGGGGGGGSGGCGAPRAEGGEGGGASVAIVVRLAPGMTAGPRFEALRVQTESGGNGGDGGVGARGGQGGDGQAGGVAPFWCARNGGRGGDGGDGGAGGGGGGGCGGGSHAFAVTGASVDPSYLLSLETTTVVELAGVAGAGGRAGFSPGSAGGAGESGGASVVLRF